LLNLGNILEAALAPDAEDQRFYALLRAEAEAAFTAAGIAWRAVGTSDPRREPLMRYQPVAGIGRSGGSSTQSLARGAGSIETDYLNGVVVLLGRLHGVPVPANAFFVDLSARMVRDKLRPGAFTPAQLEAGLAAVGVVFRT
jgi:2-dehydropantoate 2-reductase